MCLSGLNSLTLAFTRISHEWTRGFNPLKSKGLKAPCLKNTDSHISGKKLFSFLKLILQRPIKVNNALNRIVLCLKPLSTVAFRDAAPLALRRPKVVSKGSGAAPQGQRFRFLLFIFRHRCYFTDSTTPIASLTIFSEAFSPGDIETS